MKTSRKPIFILIIASLIGALLYWQFNKKQIIRQAIQSAVEKGSDSLYSIRYDSSSIDEVAGNAVFYNLRLQSDSLYSLLKSDSLALMSAIISIWVPKLEVRGVNVAGLISGNKIEANEIQIERPNVHIILPPGDSVRLNAEDSLKLYERITGGFKLISSGLISLRDGSLSISNGSEVAHTNIKGINLNISNLKIDSTKNYNNLVSYFVNEMESRVDSVILLSKNSSRIIRIAGINYSAIKKFVKVERYVESDNTLKNIHSDIRHTGFSNLSTADFIQRREISADTFYSSGGKIQIEIDKSGGTKDLRKQITINNEYFNKVHIRNISFGKADVSVIESKSKKEIAEIKGLSLRASGIDAINFNFNIPWVLENSNWVIAGDRIIVPQKNADYKTEIGKFVMNKLNATVTVESVKLNPVDTDEQFMRKQKHQKDHYRISLVDLQMTGVRFNEFLNQTITAETARVQPDLYIYNDRTLPPDVSSKVGKYPQQMLQKLPVPISIDRLNIRKGKVVYREKGAISKKSGDVIFTGINATVNNFSNTNKKEMVLNAEASFLGIASLKTQWRFPMHLKNGSFFITATINKADARKFTKVTEPLGMAQIKSGKLNKFELDMKGDDYGSAGSAKVLYKDLNITYLEEPKGNDTINKKNLLTFFANIFTKDANPSNGKTRINSVGIPRDTSRSFFNLVWKSIFEGVKKTAAGKSM